MRRTPAFIASALAALALTGCASLGTTDAAASPSASAACTTHACIVDEAQQSLVGIVAKDESVVCSHEGGLQGA